MVKREEWVRTSLKVYAVAALYPVADQIASKIGVSGCLFTPGRNRPGPP